MASVPVIQFPDMAYLQVFGKYVCCHKKCPANKNMDHVWVADELPNACGKCKRITWNRKDRRFKEEPRPKAKPRGRKK